MVEERDTRIEILVLWQKANNSYDNEIVDWSRHRVTKYLSEEKPHGAIEMKKFKHLDFINDELYEVEFVNLEIEHKEPINVGFFIQQYARLRMLELYYNFFDKLCDFTRFEELEMDTDLFYLALSEDDLYDSIRPARNNEWNSAKWRLYE